MNAVTSGDVIRIAFVKGVGKLGEEIEREGSKDRENDGGKEPVERNECCKDYCRDGNGHFSDIINEDHYIFYLS